MRDYETIPCPQYKCNQEYSSGTIVDLAMPTHEEAATWWRKMIEKTSTENLVHTHTMHNAQSHLLTSSLGDMSL